MMTDIFQVFTFMLAGHETTSVALAWTLYELAKNPLIQEKVRAEINTALCEGNELTWDTVEELKYLEKVIKESLRLHPPAHVTGRAPTSDEIIGGYLIPKGTVVIFPINALQRVTQHWSNPDEFEPERFDEKGNLVFVSLLGNGCSYSKAILADAFVTHLFAMH